MKKLVKLVGICLLIASIGTIALFFTSQSTGIEIAIYKDKGTFECHLWTAECLEFLGYQPDYATSNGIIDGELENYDLLIMPGGDVAEQFLGLGEKGIDNIRGFIKKGGDYVGICAGSYLAWEVAILPENYTDPTKEVALGIGDINFVNVLNRTGLTKGWEEVAYIETNEGSKVVIFPTEWYTEYKITFKGDEITVLYAGGPLFEDGEKVVATYTGEVEKSFPPPEDFRRKMLTGSGAIATNECYEGEIVLFSFHPELKPESYFMLDEAIKWVTENEKMFFGTLARLLEMT
jgi:glutamine amidotransferase-like uncharacterized protein